MWKRAGAHIVSETIEGEVIIVNLLEGVYFSIIGSGPQIWDCISSGYSTSESVDLLSVEYTDVPVNLADKINEFAEKLVEEGLLVRSEEAIAKGNRVDSPSGQKRKFEDPQFSKFTDMEDVLLLDPVHDFDESGWPNQVGVGHQQV